LQLQRRLHQVARPPSGSVAAFVTVLPPAPSSPSSGHQNSLQLRRRPGQVASDLPSAPSSPSSNTKTFLWLRYHLRQVARSSYGSDVAFTSSEDLLSDFVLLVVSFCKHNNLQFCIIRSGGRLHAHGIASELPCGFIAQQCSMLASFSFTVLFIANTAPRAAGEVLTLSPRGNGVCSLCIIKGDDITLSDSRRLCRLCINDA
jgi:hypothetical protein